MVAARPMDMKMTVVTDKVELAVLVVPELVAVEDEVEERAAVAEPVDVEDEAEEQAHKANEPIPSVVVVSLVGVSIIITIVIAITVVAEIHHKLLSKMVRQLRQMVVAVKPMIESRQPSTPTATRLLRVVAVVVTMQEDRRRFRQATEPTEKGFYHSRNTKAPPSKNNLAPRFLDR
jgi:hypothetical protein